MDSLADKLAEQGYLTASGFCDYVKEVRPILAVSYPTLMRYIKDGKIRSVTVGGQTRISKEEIEKYLKNGEEGEQPSSTVFRTGQDSQQGLEQEDDD